MRRRTSIRVTTLCLVLACLLGGCTRADVSADGPGSSVSAGADPADTGPVVAQSNVSCVAQLEFDGHVFQGWGPLVRDPKTTGRVEMGVTNGPDCTLGPNSPKVEVAELADLPMSRAVLVNGVLYVRSDRPFPEIARHWDEPPTCATEGPFALRGEWLGVEGGPDPRFDGDIRPPYRVSLHVSEGPADYVGTTIELRVTAETSPALTPHDVKTVLWEGGSLDVQARCDGTRFLATGFSELSSAQE